MREHLQAVVKNMIDPVVILSACVAVWLAVMIFIES
nr:MAG TPA: hypothetical protein [Caudoviricetes sp.]